MPFGGLLIGGLALAGSAASSFGRSNPTYDYKDTDLGNYFKSQVQGGMAGMNNSYSGGAFHKGQAAQQSYGDMLNKYSNGGYIPSSGDISQSNNYAASQFAAQHVQMQQSFQDQLRLANQQAAMQGRSLNDPILKAKLAQEQTRQESTLNAQQGAFASQYAQQMPGQRLAYAGQAASTFSQIGQNDMNAQANLYGLAQSGLSQQQNLAMAQATGNFQQQEAYRSPWQNLGSTISGGIAGVGAGMQAASAFGGMGSSVPTGGSSGYSLGSNTQFAPAPNWNFSGGSSPMGGGSSGWGNPSSPYGGFGSFKY